MTKKMHHANAKENYNAIWIPDKVDSQESINRDNKSISELNGMT